MSQPRDQKPWERVGLSRATYYRRGKPPEVVQKAGAQMVYTADGGMQRLPEIAREIQKKPDLAQFRVCGWLISLPRCATAKSMS